MVAPWRASPFRLHQKGIPMNQLIRTGIAGFAAWKWGGGLLGAIVLFLIVYYLLGYLG